jgi:hypothetical protein
MFKLEHSIFYWKYQIVGWGSLFLLAFVLDLLGMY